MNRRFHRSNVARAEVSPGRSRRLVGLTAAILLPGVLLAACSDADPAQAQPSEVADRPLVGTEWHLTAPVAATDDETVLREIGSTITFGSDRRVSGKAGCNRFTGTAEVDAESVVFGALATTRMACDPVSEAVESEVLAVLDGTVAYRITGDRLELTRTADTDIDAEAGPLYYTAG